MTRKLNVTPLKYTLLDGLDIPFGSIGVFGEWSESQSTRTLRRIEILGKCIVEDTYIVCAPPAALSEGSY